MGEYNLTAEIAREIVKINFSSLEFQPNSAVPLLSATDQFINELLRTQSLENDTKSTLLWVKNNKKTERCCHQFNNDEQSEIFDSSEWLPKQTYKAFQKESEVVSLYISGEKSELIHQGGMYVKWVSASDAKIDCEAIRGAKLTQNISVDQWGLVFEPNVQYKVEAPLRTISTTCLCVTFQVDKPLLLKEQFLIYDKGDFDKASRGISFINNILRIWGVSNRQNHIDVNLPKTESGYTTVFIEWPGEAAGNIPGRYFINGKKIQGSFSPRQDIGLEGELTTIGGKINEVESGFKGVIASVDIFNKDTKLAVPSHLIDLIVYKQMIE